MQQGDFNNRQFSGVNEMGDDITSSGNHNINNKPAWRTWLGRVNGLGEDTTSNGHHNINYTPSWRTNINNDGQKSAQK